MSGRKPIAKKRYVLVAIEAGDDQSEANRLMADVLGRFRPEEHLYATTVDMLPMVLRK